MTATLAFESAFAHDIRSTADVVQALLDGAPPPAWSPQPQGPTFPLGALVEVYGPDDARERPWPERVARALHLAWHDLAAGQLVSAQNRHWRLVHSQPDGQDYLPPSGTLARQVAVKRLSALVYLDEATFVLADDSPAARTPGALRQRRHDLDDLRRRARRDALAAHDRDLCRLTALIGRYGERVLGEQAVSL